MSLQMIVLRLLELRRGNVPNGSEGTVVVEPPDPFQGGQLDVLETPPRAPSPNDLRPEESDHGFGPANRRCGGRRQITKAT